MNAILDLLRLESSNMQVSNSVLKLEEFHGFEEKVTQFTKYYYKKVSLKAFAREIAYKYMNTDYTATRMLGYLYRMTELKEEQLVDEMIAILEDRDRIIKKHEMEQAQAAINRIYLTKGWNKLVNSLAVCLTRK